MKTITFTRNLGIGVIILFVAAFGLPSNGLATLDGGNILVYATYTGPGQGGYDKTWWDEDLPTILQNEGYSVTVTDRVTTPTITTSLLAEYDELWIINARYTRAGCFSATEINTILSYREDGHGLLINGDHTDYWDGFAYDANQISIPLGVTFYGRADHGGPEIEPDFQDHPLFVCVTTIHGDISEAFISVNNSAEVVATFQGDNIIAVLDDGMGRVVFDNTIARFMDTYVLRGNTPQYARNIACWLMGCEPSCEQEIPTLTEWGLIIFGVVLLGFITYVFLRRRKAVVSLR